MTLNVCLGCLDEVQFGVTIPPNDMTETYVIHGGEWTLCCDNCYVESWCDAWAWSHTTGTQSECTLYHVTDGGSANFTTDAEACGEGIECVAAVSASA